MINDSFPKYSAVCASVTPTEAKSELEKIDSCYLGVSLQTPAFEPPQLNATVDWIATKFASCTVAVGDSIHRHTLQILRGISAEAALKEALKLGDRFVTERAPIFAKHERCIFDFVRFSEIQETNEYKEFERQIWHLFERDAGFRSSIYNSARGFVARRVGKFQSHLSNKVRFIELSCQYLLEEIACFTWLSSRGLRVDVYPGGELPVLIEVARGKYAVPSPLKDRINIALKISKKD